MCIALLFGATVALITAPPGEHHAGEHGRDEPAREPVGGAIDVFTGALATARCGRAHCAQSSVSAWIRGSWRRRRLARFLDRPVQSTDPQRRGARGAHYRAERRALQDRNGQRRISSVYIHMRRKYETLVNHRYRKLRFYLYQAAPRATLRLRGSESYSRSCVIYACALRLRARLGLGLRKVSHPSTSNQTER